MERHPRAFGPVRSRAGAALDRSGHERLRPRSELDRGWKDDGRAGGPIPWQVREHDDVLPRTTREQRSEPGHHPDGRPSRDPFPHATHLTSLTWFRPPEALTAHHRTAST